jgi:hypothetical protein
MQIAGENSQFPTTAAASIAAVHESAFRVSFDGSIRKKLFECDTA